MKMSRLITMKCSASALSVVLWASYGIAQSNSKYACTEPHPEQLCNASNTCGSASSPCVMNVKRTANAASSTAVMDGAKGNSLVCVHAGTTVQWKSDSKDIGFVVDMGTTSPFDPGGAIIGGSDRTVSVVAKTPGCYKYSAGACKSGAIYGMCGTGYAKFVIIGGN
jgi:plastocyanin